MKQYLLLFNLLFILSFVSKAQEIDFYDPVEVFDAGVEIVRMNTADIDGDGIVEIIYSRVGSENTFVDSTVVLKQDLTGQYVYYWSVKISYDDVKVADMNNDGKNDLVFTDNTDLRVFINNGIGGFNPMLSYHIGGDSQELSIADLNNDGYLDVVAPTTHELDPSYFFNTVFINNKNGTLKTGIKYVYPTVYPNNPISGYYVSLLDMNDDGYKDIVNPFRLKDSLLIYLNKGDGTFNTPDRVVFPKNATHTQVLDLDHDGKEDLACVVSDYISGTFNVLYTQAFFLQKSTIDQDILNESIMTDGRQGIDALNISDINNDGDYDLIYSQHYLLGGAPDYPQTDSLVIYLNKGNLTFDLLNSSYASLVAPYSLMVSDYNGDGFKDLLYISYDTHTLNSKVLVMYQKALISSIKDENLLNARLNVFPNPTAGKLCLKMEKSTIQSIVLYDALGRKTFEERIADGVDYKELDISRFAKGLYLIQVESSNGVLRREQVVLQ